MPVFVSAETAGTTETEAKERARVAQVASDALLVRRDPGSSASLTITGEPGAVSNTFTPGRSLRVVLDGSASECTVRAGSASVQFSVDRMAVKEGRKTLSDMITAKQKEL